MTQKILVVDDTPMNLKMVSAIMNKEGYQTFTAPNAEQALRAVGQDVPDLAILDVMMPDVDGFELCRRLRRMPETANIPIIMLTALTEIDERLKAFEAGADDFMAKPFQPQELAARVKALLRRAAPQMSSESQMQGHMIALFSLRGGAGTSTLATNLSVGLAQVWGQPIALVDLALINGASALMLDIPLRNTWADLASMKPDEIDPEILNKVLMRHDSGVHVLAAPSRPQEAELLTAAHVSQALRLLRRQNMYVVVDLPHDFSAMTLAALDEADHILLLLSPEMASVRSASIALDVFKDLGYPDEKTSLLLNWTFKGSGLPRSEIENSLKQKIRVVVPFADESFVAALTLGKPPTFVAPASPIGALFEDLAYFLSEDEHKKNKPDPQPVGYIRVRERAQTRQKKK